MPNVKNVGFASPSFDYSADLSEIERRKALAAMLTQQGLQQEPTQQVGGWAVRQPKLGGLAKVAQVIAGQYGQKSAEDQQRTLAQTARTDLADVLRRGSQADPTKAAEIYMQHPTTMPLGLASAQKNMESAARQRMLASILQPGGQPPSGGPTQVASTAPTPLGSAPTPPAPNMLSGIPPQVMALMTSGDPELVKLGTTLMEANKGIAQRPGAPVVNPFTGAVIAQAPPTMPQGVGLNMGPAGPSAFQVPGMAGAQTAQHSVPKPDAPMVKLPMSGGQTIELTQPEYLEWQRTQQLPGRFGGPQGAPPAGPTPAPAPGLAPAGGPPAGLGVPGMTQSPTEVTREQAQRAANVEASKEFISEMRQNYAKLRDVPATLENIERGKALAASSARSFMGPFGESKLSLTKFFRSNVPGMGSLNTEGVTNAEALQSTLFNQVMDNLKKMDASPSQYQQQVMQEAFGTLRTDPKSVPKIMEVFADILRNRVDIHNQTVKSAEGRGTTFPHDVGIKLPNRPTPPGTLTPDEQRELDALRNRFGR